MDDHLVKVGVWIPKDQRTQFAIACRKLGFSMSEILRTAIHAIIAKAEQEEWNRSPEAQEARELAQAQPDDQGEGVG